MVGQNITKSDVDQIAGNIAVVLRDTLDRVLIFKEWLDTKTDGDLIALGYVQGDVDTLRSAYGDANQLVSIFKGSASLSVAKDFRTFLKLIYGIWRR